MPNCSSVLVTHAGGREVAWCSINVTADMSTLEEQLDRADALKSAEYTPDSWAPVLPARDLARVALREAGATQATVDACATALAAAIDALVVLETKDKGRPRRP